MPRLILCADDFAFSPEVSATIVELAKAGKINAIGCMTLMPGWQRDSTLLPPLPLHIEIGLHLTLTEEAPLTAMPRLAPDGVLPTINALTRLAHRGKLPLDEIAAEIELQFDRFIDVHGRPPAFVDGHQHVHALPGIRALMLAETAKRAPDAWVRDCSDRVAAMIARPYPGKALASALKSRGLARDAARYGLCCNDGFAGHYDFTRPYEAVLPAFLRRPGTRHLVMCHPGAGARRGDAIASARPREAEALRAASIADMAAAEGLAFPA